jgi:predicted Rossmann fold flavoprotein
MMAPKTVFRAIVVGAGPAGLFCAIHASSGQGDILLLEKKPGPGRKLLVTGSGQCNITHGGAIRDFLTHYGEHGRFITPALLNFPNFSLTGFFRERGLDMLETEGGKIFPISLKSRDVLSVLVKECQSRGIRFVFNEPATGIHREGDLFRVETGSGEYYCRAVVIATGGITYPETGSTGDGYRFARSQGHTVTETAPALTPVIIEEFPFGDLPGISFRQASITIRRRGTVAGSGTGDLLFTHRGLSGPGILDCSRYIRSGDVLNVSFLPGPDVARLEDQLMDLMKEHPVSRIAGIITSIGLPERFVSSLLTVTGIPAAMTCSHVSRQQRKDIVRALTAFPFSVQSLGGPDEAMVTRGGVDLPEVNPKTMESRLVPGMFFIGEVLDIDGDTGGYNLQAAFSTGYLAGMTIRER